MQFETGSWNDTANAIYMTGGGETLWTLISAGLCIIALIIGSRHELDAYKRADNQK
ncbi:MAG: hypothetical protein ACPGVA_12550 [Pikeienuella sp.]